VIQQAFDKMGGEGIIPLHFDPEIGDVTIDFTTVLDDKGKVMNCLCYAGFVHE